MSSPLIDLMDINKVQLLFLSLTGLVIWTILIFKAVNIYHKVVLRKAIPKIIEDLRLENQRLRAKISELQRLTRPMI